MQTCRNRPCKILVFKNQYITRMYFLFGVSIFFTGNLWAQQLPYKNPNFSSEERAKDLISRLTIEEKSNFDVRSV